jgi:hypothetical protein
MKLIRCFVFVWRTGQEMLSNRITQKQKKGKWGPEDDVFDEWLFVHVFAIAPNVGRRHLGIPFIFPLSFSFSHQRCQWHSCACCIQPEVPLSVAMREQDMPPCNDPRTRAVHCPGGIAGFYGRFFSRALFMELTVAVGQSQRLYHGFSIFTGNYLSFF